MSGRGEAAASRALAALAWAALACGGCGRGSSASTPAAAEAGAPDGARGSRGDAGRDAEDPRIADLWARAMDGDADDLVRLEAELGSDGLTEALGVTGRRLTALRALAFAEDFTALPLLAGAAASGTEEEAAAALASVATLASQPRRATDPEDAIEIREGCAVLVALARDPTRPAPRRTLAVRALRLLADRGWVAAADVPTDLDAR